MRLVLLAASLAAMLSLGGCGFLNAGGAAEARWAALEKQRAANANPEMAGNKICRRMTVTGSNLPQRVCSTQAEWDAFDEQGSASADAFNDLRGGGSSASGGVEDGPT